MSWDAAGLCMGTAASGEDNGYNARISRLESQYGLAMELINAMARPQNDLAERVWELKTPASDYLEWNKTRIDALATRILSVEKRTLDIETHLGAVTRFDDTPSLVKAREAACKQQATEHLYAPLRNDTKAVLDLAAFARRLLNPDDLGHAVTQEVRDLAREALGLKKAES